jgi:exopolyphosphatase/guanosine-5'-triphosphate,3'-diphosphate pyrophosphatase
MTPGERTLAAIDVGSNTVHLVVARLAAGGDDLRYLDDQVELVRLGADVSATGSIGTARMARAVQTVRQQTERARALGASGVLGIATEGVRSAANGAELIERVRREAGVELALVTGEQEAALTFWGATSGLDDSNSGEQGSVVERRAVVDLGGGSLELVLGEGTAVRWRVSLPLGSGALHDRYAPSDPPTEEEMEAVRAVAVGELAGLEPPLPVGSLVACGGTATTLVILAARALLAGEGAGQVGEEPGSIAGSLDEKRMADLLDLLRGKPAEAISQRFGVDPGRARLLGAGCVVLREAMRRVGAKRLEVSRRGVREGALLAYAHTGDSWLAAAERGTGW